MGGNSSLIMSVSLYDKLPFDPVKDFAPISQIFVAANLLVVHPDVPAKSIAELVALAKAKPGELTYGHTGPGSSQHLAGELFKYMAKVNIQPVAYRGSTAVLPDLLAGRITMAFSNVVNVAPLVREGKLRAFAVTSRKRSVRGARPADHGRDGLSGFRGGAVVRAAGAGRHAAGRSSTRCTTRPSRSSPCPTCASGSRTPAST